MTTLQSSKAGFHRLLRGIPRLRRHARLNQCRCQSTASALVQRAAPHLPKILQPSTWESVIPPTIRAKTKELFAERQKKSNPATYFIWIYIFIGSQAIRILGVKNDHKVFSRKADLQIEKLREVVRRLQAGEEVDVEKALGTGVPEEEQAWEDALREIEKEEQLWHDAKQKKKDARARRLLEAEEAEKQKQDASPVSESTDRVSSSTSTESQSSTSAQPVIRSPAFY